MNFKGKALPLSDGDVRIVAGYLGCTIAAVRAVLAIESAGKGFAADGRPIILNEPHWLYRNLSGAQRTQAVKAGLAYSQWGAKPYPKTQSARYDWLAKAAAINLSAALKSCSWGLGQVMGFNHKVCGFADAVAFVEAMKHSEGAQLMAVARFIVSNKLQGHLQTRTWSSFAKGYNGAGYAKHGYHTKLANAYARRPASEKIVPPIPSAAELAALSRGASDGIASPIMPPPPDTTPETWSPNRGVYLKRGDKGARFAELIEELSALGFYHGAKDNKFGPATEAAVRAYQKSKGLTADGIAGPVTLDSIDLALKGKADVRSVAVGSTSGAAGGAVAASGAILAGFDPWIAVGIGVAIAFAFAAFWVFKKD